jgi:hypothetical protein
MRMRPVVPKADNPRRSAVAGKSGKTGSPKATAKAANKPVKRPTNLTLDPEAIARGEWFSRKLGVSLSQLVSRLLRALPTDDDRLESADLTPVVKRLYGVAERAATNREDYRKHLRQKYGGHGE